MIRRALVAAVALGPVLAPFAACGDGGGGASDVAETGAPETAVADGGQKDSLPTDVATDQGATYNTDGWVKIPFDQACDFYAAPSPEKMLPSIKWADCDAGLNLLGWTCRQIAFEWAPPKWTTTQVSGVAKKGWVAPDGKAWLLVSRWSGDSIYDLVAEADGRVHGAVAVSKKGDCFITEGDLAGSRVVYTAAHQDEKKIYRWGAIGGDVDDVPGVLETSTEDIGRGYAAGPNAYFTIPENALKTWTAPSSVVANVPQPDPGQAVQFDFVGDTMFFPIGNLSYHRIKSFSTDAGLQDFISYGNDVSKGAADFGTDGKDMVWTEAMGRSSTSEPWAAIDIMTAPFTTEPSAIVKRRLRSEANSIGAAPFVVGCGFASHQYSSSTEGTGTRLVRLSDGRSWRFTRVMADGGYNWLFNGPLAITCDELFVQFHRGFQFNVARIRLDSLGPGDAPD